METKLTGSQKENQPVRLSAEQIRAFDAHFDRLSAEYESSSGYAEDDYDDTTAFAAQWGIPV